MSVPPPEYGPGSHSEHEKPTGPTTPWSSPLIWVFCRYYFLTVILAEVFDGLKFEFDAGV